MEHAHSNSHNPEELLQHAGWLRALARSLVRDAATADDLVQDTLQAALTSPPRRDGVRAWLARVLRNEAAQKRRGEARRLQRERASARGEELPSAGDLAARMELQRQMVEGVLRLDEPYRSTIVLRYYEGLSSAEIARRQDLPAGTVRSRLKRGLDELREGLDAQADGKREAWCAVLLPWIDTPEKTSLVTAGALASGVLTMSTGMKLTVAAGALTAAIIGYRVTQPDSPTAPEVESAGVARPMTPVEASAPATEAPSPAPAEDLRTVVDASPVEIPEEPEVTLPFTITARVMDPHRSPIEGARLAVIGVESEAKPSAADGSLTSTFDGAYTKVSLRIEISRDGYATHRDSVKFERDQPVDLGQVVLARGGSMEGLLLDEHGQPAADVEVRATIADISSLDARLERIGPDPWAPRITAITDAHGRFRFDGLTLEYHVAWARRADTLWAMSEPALIREDGPGPDVVLNLRAATPEDFLRLRVLSPAGDPAPGCFVRYRYKDELTNIERYANTDDEGRVELLAVPSVTYEVRIEDRSGPWPDLIEDEVPTGEEVVLRFGESPLLSFLVVDSAGEPVDGAKVSVSEGGYADDAKDGTGDDLGLLVAPEPSSKYWLTASAEGYVERRLGPFEVGTHGSGDPFRIQLSSSAGLSGRVLVNDVPASGAKVELFLLAGPFEGIRTGGFLVYVNPWVEAQTTSDPRGRFHFRPSASGRYLVRSELEGYAPAEFRITDYDANLGFGNADLHLSPGGAIEGRVIVPAGGSAAGTQVIASRGDARPMTQSVTKDGSYRFENLMPGPWSVVVANEETKDDGSVSFRSLDAPPEWPFDCEVFEGQTTYHDLDLRDVPVSTVTGELTVDGAPAVGWIARLDTSGQNFRTSDVPQALFDSEGRYELESAIEGSHTLSWVAAEEDGRILLFQRELMLLFGVTDVSLNVETAPVRVENVPSGETHFLLWEDVNGHVCRAPLMPGEDGVAEVPRFPLGELRVTTSPGERHDWTSVRVLARESHGASGTTVTLP